MLPDFNLTVAGGVGVVSLRKRKMLHKRKQHQRMMNSADVSVVQQTLHDLLGLSALLECREEWALLQFTA